LELYKEYAEEAYSIALHPSGLYVAVGFSDKLRFMNLLIDDIRTFREFAVRGCREVITWLFITATRDLIFCNLKKFDLKHKLRSSKSCRLKHWRHFLPKREVR